jgi:hypothetical protein
VDKKNKKGRGREYLEEEERKSIRKTEILGNREKR